MKLIIITGRANSGKTTLAKYLSKELGIKSISSSDYTKTLINNYSRSLLEKKFNEIVNKHGYEYLACKIIEYGNFKNIGIIDGPRHLELVNGFKKCIGNINCLLIGIQITQENRFKFSNKAKKTESFSYKEFEEFEKNSTHEIFADETVNHCDILIGDELVYSNKETYLKIKNNILNWI